MEAHWRLERPFVAPDYRQNRRCCCTRRRFAEHWNLNTLRERRVGMNSNGLGVEEIRRTVDCMKSAVIADSGIAQGCMSSTTGWALEHRNGVGSLTTLVSA